MIKFTATNLKARCEQGREVGRPTSTWKSATGEPYVVIGSQSKGMPSQLGTVDEGCGHKWAFDEETAYFRALACFETYAHGKSGKLYWRIEPQLETDLGFKRVKFGEHKFIFYMRCLISDKPEIIQTVEALLA